MNILIYMDTPTIGGVRTVTEILSQEFGRRGHSVFILMLKRIYGDNRDIMSSGESVYFPAEDLLNINNQEYFSQFVSNNNIDIIVNQTGLCYESVLFFNKMNELGIPTISVLHSNPYFEYQWLFKDAITLRDNSIIEKFKLIARLLLFLRTKKNKKKSLDNLFELIRSGGSHVCVLSPSYINCVKELNPQIAHITAIANPNTYTSTHQRHKEKIVLFVGRLDNRSKKIQYLLSIWKNTIPKSNDWKLIIVGDGQDKKAIEDRIAKIQNVELHGYQDPTPYYERASILCMTSIFEGFPMVVTEAMQHGCVPLAYDSFPAIYDIIDSGKDGIIVPAFKSSEYKRCLLKLMNDDKYLSKLSEAAKNNVNRFNRDKIVIQWENLFKRLISTP